MLFQIYALRAFDSVLVAAYGLHNFLMDNNILTHDTNKVEICSAKNYTSRHYGETLMKYISKVREFNHKAIATSINMIMT